MSTTRVKSLLDALNTRLYNWLEGRRHRSRFPPNGNWQAFSEPSAPALSLEPELVGQQRPPVTLPTREFQPTCPASVVRKPSSSWASRLRRHTTLRDALIVREIIGPPVSMRRVRR
jgi:hypothetical protein